MWDLFVSREVQSFLEAVEQHIDQKWKRQRRTNDTKFPTYSPEDEEYGHSH